MTVLAVYLLTLVAAERFRLHVRRSLETAPTALAAGIGLALTVELPGGPAGLTTLDVVGTVVLAQVIDWVLQRRKAPARRRPALLVDGALRAATVLLVSVAVRDVPLAAGRPLADVLPTTPGWVQALVLGGIVAVVLGFDIPARAWYRSRVDRTRATFAVADELRASIRLQLAMAASGVVIGLGQQALALAALPLVLGPFAVTQLAVRSQAQVHRAQLQSVRALSRLPEVAGFVPDGHSRRIADLGVAVAREVGIPAAQTGVVEFAALLHDVGQLSLRRPIPSGATVLAASADQQHLAEAGAGLVAGVGYLDEVADVVANQAVPYHHVVTRRRGLPLGSRIIKVVNAYVDHAATAGPAGEPAGHDAAIERLYLGLGYEYDPRVVAALEAVLRRRFDNGSRRPAPGTP